MERNRVLLMSTEETVTAMNSKPDSSLYFTSENQEQLNDSRSFFKFQLVQIRLITVFSVSQAIKMS